MQKYLAILLIFFGFSAHVKSQSVSEKIEDALSAVVTVTVEKTLPVGKTLMGFRGSITEEAYEKSLILSNALGSGSGFVIEKNGKKYVVTNAHVIESASDEKGSLYVYSYTQKKYEVKVVGGDSFYDVAVLEFVDNPGKELSDLTFAPNLPKIATRVFAIGNPLGEYPYSVTDGIISAVNRTRDGLTGKYGYLQSTATLIWGNSGGPLIDENGYVVGINSQIGFADGPDGNTYLQQQLNFSLEPVLSKRIVDEIIEKGKLTRAYLGIELKQRFQLVKTSQGTAIGASIDKLPVISSLTAGTDAANKLEKYIGQSITKINGVEIRNMEEALCEFEKVEPNSEVGLVISNGLTQNVVIIKSGELLKSHLEKLAETVISKLPNTSIDKSSPQLKLVLPYESPSPQFKWNSNTHSGKSGGAAYYVLAGGTSQHDVWRITTLADLGALLKIYGLRGGIEYLVTDNPNRDTPTQKITQHFSDNNSTFQTMLWY